MSVNSVNADGSLTKIAGNIGGSIENISSYFTANTATNFSVEAYKYGHIVMFNMKGKMSAEGNFADINQYTPIISGDMMMNVLAETQSGTQVDGCIQVFSSNKHYIQVFGNISSNDEIFISGIYITNK